MAQKAMQGTNSTLFSALLSSRPRNCARVDLTHTRSATDTRHQEKLTFSFPTQAADTNVRNDHRRCWIVSIRNRRSRRRRLHLLPAAGLALCRCLHPVLVLLLASDVYRAELLDDSLGGARSGIHRRVRRHLVTERGSCLVPWGVLHRGVH